MPHLHTCRRLRVATILLPRIAQGLVHYNAQQLAIGSAGSSTIGEGQAPSCARRNMSYFTRDWPDQSSTLWQGQQNKADHRLKQPGVQQAFHAGQACCSMAPGKVNAPLVGAGVADSAGWDVSPRQLEIVAGASLTDLRKLLQVIAIRNTSKHSMLADRSSMLHVGVGLKRRSS